MEPAELAADGIDEFLDFLPRPGRARRGIPLSGSYHFHTTDVSGEWVVVFDDGAVTIRREHAKADVAVRGPASDLELFLYNRRDSDGLEIFGDPAAVAAWSEAHPVLMDFYDEVLRELLVAMGAALFVGNLLALLRRRAAASSAGEDGDALPRAPVGRTVTFMVMGFVVAFWGLASLLAG